MSYREQRLTFPPFTPAIKHLMIVNAAVFVANMVLFARLSTPTATGSGAWFAFSWPLLLEGYGLGLVRFLTYQFTHSFADAWHFLGNMLMLFFLGRLAEERLGYRGTWKVYLAGGVAGALLFLLVATVLGYAHVPLVGASGAGYAMLLYAAAMAPNVMVFGCLQLWIVAAILVGVALYQTFVEFAGGFGGTVSHSAHLGGALLGYLAFRQNWFVDPVPYEYQPKPWTRLRDAWRRRRQQAAADQARHHELQLDEILAKVKANGLGSLTPAERKFLEKTSEQRRRGS